MKYEHIVYVSQDKDNYMLCVDRLFEDGRRVFMTRFEIGRSFSSETELWDEFEKLGETLGKSICIDCPDLRQIMGIE